MEKTKDGYVGPSNASEYERLDLQHSLNKHALNGRLIQAPLDSSSGPGQALQSVSILDSATANGTFILDLAASLPPTATLHGADLRPQHFPPKSSWPANVTFFAQDILYPWPATSRAAYDLVHQRNVLANIPPARVPEALDSLWACVKPGGWLQLVDGDMADILDDPTRPVMRRFREVLRGLGTNISPGPSLNNWVEKLQGADLDTVGARVVQNWFGGGTVVGDDTGKDTAEWRRLGVKNILWIVDSVAAVKNNHEALKNVDFTALKEDLEIELNEKGNRWKTHIVWVQKLRD